MLMEELPPEAALDGPREVAVAGEVGGALHRVALLATAPGAVVAAGRPDGELPLLAGRSLVDGEETAYVCRGFVCDRPTTDGEELARALGVSR